MLPKVGQFYPKAHSDTLSYSLMIILRRSIHYCKEIYANASYQDQQRFNRIVERVQDGKRGIPPEDSE